MTEQGSGAFVNLACSVVEPQAACETHRRVDGTKALLVFQVEFRAMIGGRPYEMVWPTVYTFHQRCAESFRKGRLFLVGDAAHVIHPIAGQGLNMGLRDIAALAEAVVDAARLGLDPGDPTVLERYQRWRRFDTMAMGVATDGLNRLFSNRSDVLRLARDVGLGLVDRFPALKRVFIREAAGLLGEAPKLLRGERL